MPLNIPFQLFRRLEGRKHFQCRNDRVERLNVAACSATWEQTFKMRVYGHRVQRC